MREESPDSTGKTELHPSCLFLIFIRGGKKSQFLFWKDRTMDSEKNVILILRGDSTTLWVRETLHKALAQSSLHGVPLPKAGNTATRVNASQSLST